MRGPCYPLAAFHLMKDPWPQVIASVQESLSDERNEPVARRPLRHGLVFQTAAMDAVGRCRR